MAPQLHVQLQSDRRPEQVAELTRALAAELNRLPHFDASEVTRAPRAGEKSLAVAMLGQLVVAFVSEGAAKVLVDLLRSFFEREKSLVVILKQPDGTEVRIEGRDLKPERLAEITRALKPLESTA